MLQHYARQNTPLYSLHGGVVMLVLLGSSLFAPTGKPHEIAAPHGCVVTPLDELPPMPAGNDFTVIVVVKDATHPYFGQGTTAGYQVNGVQGMELTLVRGTAYTFGITTPGHPFVFTNSSVGGFANTASVITSGVVNGGIQSGVTTFTPNAGHAALIYYNCNVHESMGYIIHIVDPVIQLAATVMLDGPYNTGTLQMNDDLRAAALLPASEPYTALGYTFVGGGGETMLGGVTAVTGNDAIVDWVLVEVRDAVTPTTVLASRAALVQRDGAVVDMNGTSPVQLNVTTGSYYVAIKHRNHLAVMTAAPMPLVAGSNPVDFTLVSTATFGTNARKLVGSVQTLWAGDATFNGQVKYSGGGNDRDVVLTAIGGTVISTTISGQYRIEDLNLNGLVRYSGTNNDRDIILSTIGGTVPSTVRNAQLP